MHAQKSRTFTSSLFAVRLLKTQIIFLPRIFFAVDRNGNSFGIVARRAAAHGQQQVRLVLTGNLDALVIDSILFDGTIPVNQHHIRAIFGKFGVQVPCFCPPWSCVLSGWFFLAPWGPAAALVLFSAYPIRKNSATNWKYNSVVL